jgi:replicative DNA helicase
MAASDTIRPLAPAPEFERQPPQDLAAEQSVLGGMLLSKDAIADVVEVLRSTDFYRPAHQLVYDVVLDLYGRGEPADPVTVAAELVKRGEIGRVGGAPYLHTLISSVPTAANAGYYARIVAEQAILRRLVEAGTRIVQLGYGSAAGGGLDVDEVVDRAQQAIYDVTERRTSEDYVILEQLLQGTLDEIESIGNRGGGMIGVPAGFVDLDALLNGLHPGQLIVVAARPGVGKALALDTPLPTPTGWTTMGEVGVGDYLIGADGRPARVVAATEVMHDRPCFALTFSDGEVVVADAQHQWQTTSRRPKRHHRLSAASPPAAPAPAILTTRQIAASIGRASHGVALARPLELPDADLPLPAYVIGAWLAAGHPCGARIRTGEAELAMRIESHGIDVVPQVGRTSCGLAFPGGATVLPALRDLGVLGNKHVPPAYLRGSERQRRQLLAGLLDAGGTVTHGGSVQFGGAGRLLADGVRELVHSLSYRSRLSLRHGGGPGRPARYTVTFSADDEVFRLESKRLAHKQRSYGSGRVRQRSITDVRPVASTAVRCVEVDNADHLYLAGRSMIPTHNSTLGLDFARSCSIKHGMASVIFSLEMSKSEITMRLLSAEAKVPLHHMRSGTMSDDDWARMARRMGEVAGAPLFIDDSPNMTMMEIRAKARRLKQRHELRLIIVDYLQLMSSPKRVESRQQEVSELSRGLKLLAKELEVPVVAMSQLNRGPEQRTDKRPQLADLRESGAIEQDSDVVIMLYREDMFEKESPRAGEADLIVAKHRNGPTGSVTVAFQGHYSRFRDFTTGP